MIEKVKKVSVIITIAILFALLCFSIVDVIIQEPRYEDYCPSQERPYTCVIKEGLCPAFQDATEEENMACGKQRGMIEYSYDAYGCPKSYKCNTCTSDLDNAGKGYRLIAFIIASILGLIAIIAGMYVESKQDIMEWVFSGLVIGGIASIFVGTMMYFADMGRYIKPFIILAEMALIIWVAIKTSKKMMKRK